MVDAKSALSYFCPSFGSSQRMVENVAYDMQKRAFDASCDFESVFKRIYAHMQSEFRIKSIDSLKNKILTCSNDYSSYDDNFYSVNDLFAARGVAESASDIDAFVENIIQEMKNGNILIGKINNFHSQDIEPYFTKKTYRRHYKSA